MMRPFLITASGSMPTTFSPMVRPVPASAEPMAKPSQLFLAMLVEPMPEISQGSLNFRPWSLPSRTSRETAGKMALSLSAAMPWAPTAVPMMLNCE